jgi:hypothetical protein
MLDPDPDEMNADPQPCQKVRLSKGGAAMVRAGGEGTVQAAAARGSTVVFLLLLLNGVEEELVFELELRSATVTPERLTSYAVYVTNRMQH